MRVLITGGARSGKSGFAERLVMSLSGPLNGQAVYVATGQAFDEEMERRIALHRRQREESGFTWQTAEEPVDLPGLLERLPAGSAVLVDCLTLWLSNVLLAAEGHEDREAHLEQELMRLELGVKAFNGALVMVTNEVGSGIVPEYALGRLYRDLAGQMNKRIAAICGQVFLVTAGIPIELKSREYKL